MKLIRMTKTLAGPDGVFTVGSQRTVSDAEAAALKEARAADIIADITEETEGEILTPDRPATSSGAEIAAVVGAPERAVRKRPAKKKAG